MVDGNLDPGSPSRASNTAWRCQKPLDTLFLRSLTKPSQLSEEETRSESAGGSREGCRDAARLGQGEAGTLAPPRRPLSRPYSPGSARRCRVSGLSPPRSSGPRWSPGPPKYQKDRGRRGLAPKPVMPQGVGVAKMKNRETGATPSRERPHRHIPGLPRRALPPRPQPQQTAPARLSRPPAGAGPRVTYRPHVWPGCRQRLACRLTRSDGARCTGLHFLESGLSPTYCWVPAETASYYPPSHSSV